MKHNSKIEWLVALAEARGMRADVWNPIEGCSSAGPACLNCWAAREVHMHGCQAGAVGQRFGGLTMVRDDGRAAFTGAIRVIEADLDKPLRTRKPTVWFVCSRSDLFHAMVTDGTRNRIFAVMALCPQHLFIVLTKRPAGMRAHLSNPEMIEEIEGNAHLLAEAEGLTSASLPMTWPLPNVWAGTSVLDQPSADRNMPHLLATPAAKRIVSLEPMLGPIESRWTDWAHRAVGESYRQYLERNGSINEYEGLRKLDWVICGGESGPKARDNDFIANARSLLAQCQASGTPFFGKQGVKKAPLPDDLMVREVPHD
jgi:protein gp37